MYSNVVPAVVAELASETCYRVKRSKQKKMYECTRCGYTSERKSNVGRHFRRIHCELKKHKICIVCEKSFSTKGEFYEHCEKEHPHLRNSCYITSEKYKIGKKQNRRRRNQARSSQRIQAASDKRASIDETSEEETSDSTVYDNDNENVKRIEEEPAEFEEMEDQEISEEMEDYQEDDEQNEQENIEHMDDEEKGDEKVEDDYITPSPHKEEMRKVIVQEISKVYAPILYPSPDNDDSSSWSHKANESLTSSPVRSLRNDFPSPILWTPTSYKLPSTPSSSTELDEPISSPARTIKTDDFIFSPAKSVKTDDSILSPANSHKNDDSISSSASSVTSDDYSSSPLKAYKTKEFMSSNMRPNFFSSTSAYSSEAGPSSSFAYCNMSPSCSGEAVDVNTFPTPRRDLPLKKRFINFTQDLTQRKHLADITNMQNNELNVKSRFNNNEMQVANRNFSALNEHQQAFYTNIDFDDLEAVLILKSLKESNH